MRMAFCQAFLGPPRPRNKRGANRRLGTRIIRFIDYFDNMHAFLDDDYYTRSDTSAWCLMCTTHTLKIAFVELI